MSAKENDEFDSITNTVISYSFLNEIFDLLNKFSFDELYKLVKKDNNFKIILHVRNFDIENEKNNIFKRKTKIGGLMATGSIIGVIKRIILR